MLTNNLNLPQPFVDAATSHHEYKPYRYSVTEVLGGTCEAVLKRRHQGEQEEDVADKVWAIFGTAVHKVLEQAEGTESQIQEQWLSVAAPVDGYELSGIFDLYDESTGTVTDWKTTSVWQVMFGEYDKWRRQTMLYCWMLQSLGFDARRGEVVAILRDHSMRKAKTENGYPPHPVVRVSWEFTPEDMRQVERELDVWFADVRYAESLPDELLEPCSPEERWHKDDKWAVRKGTTKKALRLLNSKEEADRWIEEHSGAYGSARLWIEHRDGEDTRCQSYCSVAQFCPHGRKFFD